MWGSCRAPTMFGGGAGRRGGRGQTHHGVQRVGRDSRRCAMNPRQGRAVALGAVLMVLPLAACTAGRSPVAAPVAPSGASAPAAPAPPTEPLPLVTLKLAGQPALPAAPRYVAIERGYLREEGIELEEVPSTTSAQMLPALAAGQIDMGLGGPTSGLFNAIAQGIPVRMALNMWTAYPGDRAGGLIVRQDLADSGQVRDSGDLAGLRIAITAKGHATQFALYKGLRQGGLLLEDVETTELSYPDMNVALGNGNVDGAITIEPYATQAVVKGIAARLKPWSELI